MTHPVDRFDPRRRSLLGLGLGGFAGLAELAGCATGQEASRAPASPATADSTSAGDIAIGAQVVPFSTSDAIGRLPAGWQPYVLRRDRPTTHYALARDDGRAVLHARATSASSGLHCAVAIDPRAMPLLQFSWRVAEVPELANVEIAERDNCPARLVLGFGGDEARLSLRDRLIFEQFELFTGHRLPYATLMYVWDGTLAPDHLCPNHRTARIQYLAVESGSRRAGRWLYYQRDVVADYQRAFGEAPGTISSVGVLTDSDALKVELEAWYGDILFSRRQD